MELLFAALIPGWTFVRPEDLPLPARVRRQLWWIVLACQVLALLTHGVPLRLMTVKRRERVVAAWTRHRWRWLREGLDAVRSVALLCAVRRRK